MRLRRPRLGLEWALRTTSPPSSLLPAARPSSTAVSWSSMDDARRVSTLRLLDVAALSTTSRDVISAQSHVHSGHQLATAAYAIYIQLECGPVLNVMAALPTAEYRWRPLFNAAKFG